MYNHCKTPIEKQIYMTSVTVSRFSSFTKSQQRTVVGDNNSWNEIRYDNHRYTAGK